MEAFYLFLVLLSLLYAGLLIYYRKAWKAISTEKLPWATGASNKTVISVIVAARNEAENIEALIRSLQLQTYPSSLFEVIIVDDHSTDQTATIVQSFSNSNIQLISLHKYINEGPINSYKKKAIEIGIAQSKGTLIVTTDADCIVPVNWLKTIANLFEKEEPKLIVMPVVIKNNNRFIEIFQSLDFMALQGITGAAVNKNIHSMCNGANLAYTKEVFREINGFENIDHIASGDDMLLMHKIASLYPSQISYLGSSEVIVETNSIKSIKDFLNQRIRWASKANKYNDKSIFPVLLLVYLFNISLLFLMMGVLGWNLHYSMLKIPFTSIGFLLMLLFFKTIIELYFLYPVAVFFKRKTLLWFFPLMQPFHIMYTVVAGWMGVFGKYSWKERVVK